MSQATEWPCSHPAPQRGPSSGQLWTRGWLGYSGRGHSGPVGQIRCHSSSFTNARGSSWRQRPGDHFRRDRRVPGAVAENEGPSGPGSAAWRRPARLRCRRHARGPSPTLARSLAGSRPLCLRLRLLSFTGCGELARCHFLKYQAFLYIRYSERQTLDVKSAVLLHNQIVKYELN